MHWVGNGDAERAAEVIWETNPLPAVTGMVCDQKCARRCSRGLYDRPLAIRAIKRYAVKSGKLRGWRGWRPPPPACGRR